MVIRCNLLLVIEMEKTIEKTEMRNPIELVKEAVKRANKKEKQEWESNFKRRLEIGKRVKEIWSEIKRLDQREEENKMPERRYLKENEIYTMSNEELESFNRMLEEHNKKFSIWSEKSNLISSEKMKLYDESTKLVKEFNSLEYEEKWLLLSIVLRSQPTLMKYI
jgi:hypothetical protein